MRNVPPITSRLLLFFLFLSFASCFTPEQNTDDYKIVAECFRQDAPQSILTIYQSKKELAQGYFTAPAIPDPEDPSITFTMKINLTFEFLEDDHWKVHIIDIENIFSKVMDPYFELIAGQTTTWTGQFANYRCNFK